ncbi:MAG: energy transducer TonB [Vicinamibacterales bacterium]
MTPPLDEDAATVHPGYVAVNLSARGGGPFLEYQQPKRMSGALVASTVAHVLGVISLILLSRISPEFSPEGTLPERAPREIVWLAQPGPGGGGGGGGNQMKEPPRKMELPGRDQITVPVMKPAEPVPVETPPKEEPVPEPEINIPAKAMEAGITTAVGAIDATSPSSVSQGSGSGGGAGTGTGTGSGSGQGSGLGAGFGGGTGGGAYQPGNGVSAPKLLKIVQPQYTADAMRAKVQGVVVLECIVMPDGTVGEARVKRSLPFGLDDEAIKAARQWRFSPGLRQGEPVPVIIAIELSFSLR